MENTAETRKAQSAALEGLGRYFCEFSQLEDEASELLKFAYLLDDDPGADVLLRLIPFQRKIDALHAMIEVAKPKGAEQTEEWRTQTHAVLKDVNSASQLRNTFAHAHMRLVEGGLEIQSLRPHGKTYAFPQPSVWNDKQFDQEIKKLIEFRSTLALVRGSISLDKVKMDHAELFFRTMIGI